MNILVFVDWFEPGFRGGGPIRSIVSLVDELNTEINFFICTRNHDAGMREPYVNIKPNTWIKKSNGYEVFYADQTISPFIFQKIKAYTNPDLIYLNSFFSPKFSILPHIYNQIFLKTIPTLIAPRGEFNLERLSVKSVKKYSFLLVSKILNLYKTVFWHVTSDEEKLRLFDQYPRGKYLLAPNLNSHKGQLTLLRKTDNLLRVVFISRIIPYKNLHYAIEVIIELEDNIIFDFYGPIEDKVYFETCIQLASKNEKRIHYCGELKGNQVIGVLSKYHVFLFPTLGENFGHVIFEALQAGCLVLTSDKTPWKNLEEIGAGRNIPLTDKVAFISSLRKLSSLTEDELMNLRKNVWQNIHKLGNKKETRKLYLNFFESFNS